MTSRTACVLLGTALSIATSCGRLHAKPHAGVPDAAPADAGRRAPPPRRLVLGDLGDPPDAGRGPYYTMGGCVRSRADRWRCWRWSDPKTMSVTEVVDWNVATMRDIVLGDQHRCAIRDDGTVVCWGKNLQGQLGDGTAVDRSTPTPNGARDAIRLATGDMRTCTITSSGAVDCWGWRFGTEDMNQQTVRAGLAKPTTPLRSVSKPVIDMVITFGGDACKLRVDNSLDCDDDVDQHIPQPPASAGDLVRVFRVPGAVCVLSASGSLLCSWRAWGQPSYPAYEPFVPFFDGARDVSMENNQDLLVIDKDGNVFDFGLSSEIAKSKGKPKPILDHATSVASRYASCVLRDDDSIWCWTDEVKTPRMLTWTH